MSVPQYAIDQNERRPLRRDQRELKTPQVALATEEAEAAPLGKGQSVVSIDTALSFGSLQRSRHSKLICNKFK